MRCRKGKRLSQIFLGQPHCDFFIRPSLKKEKLFYQLAEEVPEDEELPSPLCACCASISSCTAARRERS